MAKKQIPQDNDWEDMGGWEDIPVKAEPQTSAGQAALEGFGQTASMGLLPKIQALAEPATDKLYSFLQGKQSPSSVDEQLAGQGFQLPAEKDYIQRRDENVARQAAQTKQHPFAAGAGKVAGALAGGALLPSIRVAKDAPLLLKMGAGALESGGQAALYDPGTKPGEQESLQLGDRLSNAGLPALFGAAMPAVKAGWSAGKELLGKTGAYAAGMTPATAREYAKNPQAVHTLGEQFAAGREAAIQRSAKDLADTAGERLSSKIGEIDAGIKEELKKRTAKTDLESLLGKDPEVDQIIMSELKQTQPNVSALKPNPEYLQNPFSARNAGVPAYLPSEAAPIIPKTADVSEYALNEARKVLDKKSNWKNVGLVDPQAIAKQTQAREMATTLRAGRNTRLPELKPQFEAERLGINLQDQLESAMQNRPVAQFISEAPDTVAQLQNIDKFTGGNSLETLSRQMTAAKSLAPKGGGLLSIPGLAIRPTGRFVVRHTMKPGKETGADLAAALQSLLGPNASVSPDQVRDIAMNALNVGAGEARRSK